MEGYSFDESFVRVKNGKMTGGEHSAADVLTGMDDRVVIVQEAAEIHVEGSIEYVSSGCRVLSADTAAGDGAVVDMSGAEQDADAGAGQSRLVYVIYDD